MFIAVVIFLGILFIAMLIIFPPSLGKTTPFYDDNGNIIEGSISEKIYVDVGDTSLGMFIIAKDKT